jgi:hypothetical protein
MVVEKEKKIKVKFFKHADLFTKEGTKRYSMGTTYISYPEYKAYKDTGLFELVSEPENLKKLGEFAKNDVPVKTPVSDNIPASIPPAPIPSAPSAPIKTPAPIPPAPIPSAPANTPAPVSIPLAENIVSDDEGDLDVDPMDNISTPVKTPAPSKAPSKAPNKAPNKAPSKVFGKNKK